MDCSQEAACTIYPTCAQLKERTVSPAFKTNDEVAFSTMTPDGRIAGTGRIVAIFAGGRSFWLHVLQPDGTVRMLFEATTSIQVREAEPASV